MTALKRGERPDLATTMGCGPLDELVGLDEELGIFTALDALAATATCERFGGHKQRRTLDISPLQATTSWESFIEAARAYGDEKPYLWACLICPADPTDPDDRPWTLASTRRWSSGVAAFQAFRHSVSIPSH